MKNILIFTPSFFPKIGGVERHLSETIPYLKKSGYSIKVITEDNVENKKSKFRVFRFSYPKIRFFGLLTIWWKIFKNYLSLIKEADIFHFFSLNGKISKRPLGI